MSKTAHLFTIRAHRTAAPILIVLIVFSSAVVVYTFDPLGSFACTLNGRSFSNLLNPELTGFQLASPGKGIICLTIRVSGLPPGDVDLAPTIGLINESKSSFSWSACSNSRTSCGGVTVSTAPPRATLPYQLLHVVWTIDAPAGSTIGVYLLWFWACSGGVILPLRIGSLSQIPMTTYLATMCPLTTQFHIGVTFHSYIGMIPSNQNVSIPATS